MAGQIVEMDALHHHDDDAVVLLSRRSSACFENQSLSRISLHIGLRVDGLKGIVDDENVAPKTRQR